MSNKRQRKPLCRLQNYLKETKNVLKLLGEILVQVGEVLVKVKDIFVILTVIVFFVLGVYEALSRLAFQPTLVEAQTVSRPLDQCRK